MMEQIQYDFFFVDTCGQKMKIKFNDLVYVESAGNYVVLTGNTFRTIVYCSLNRMMEIVEGKGFLRVHKSYVISIDHMSGIRGNECMMELSGKKIEVPIGVTYKKEVFKKLGI